MLSTWLLVRFAMVDGTYSISHLSWAPLFAQDSFEITMLNSIQRSKISTLSEQQRIQPLGPLGCRRYPHLLRHPPALPRPMLCQTPQAPRRTPLHTHDRPIRPPQLRLQRRLQQRRLQPAIRTSCRCTSSIWQYGSQ